MPFFVQSKRFLPSELRDGIRTIKANEDKEDATADENRRAIIEYTDVAIHFFEILKSGYVKNLHLLAESGLPVEKTQYTSIDWYSEKIQKKLRTYFLDQPLVTTRIGGEPITLREAKIPELHLDQGGIAVYKFYCVHVCVYERKMVFDKWG